MDSATIRDAATIILVRDAAHAPRVLMGQRGTRAAFMPNKVVFPGGAVDAADRRVPMARPIHGLCARRLTESSGRTEPSALLAAAIRELFEETGLILGHRRIWPGTPPEGWEEFARTGHIPSPAGMRFVFRAITPPGRPRRFDARFFLVDAARLACDPDDFSRASDELSHLQWIPVDRVRDFDLPFITKVVLSEVMARLPELDAPASVPFFRNDDEDALIWRLGEARGPRPV
ncbi:NUDIX hydrolase [Profundibacterium mesophilum]|uniref:Nucleoside diphosphate-linked moiety X motif 19 n=1 Tax=Profundibacterium mesophilum KAUST100406-0324 TaxID=1037889 RepID=A0A921NXM6_9RHOB|nr:NUDIX domain-containing protein [Profundibacterium mesophilum]KAF0677583.1 nucleoside diphosphate-linked moiety X motif 19 [Profundibacterium mesophilum KAUST100406-0324]